MVDGIALREVRDEDLPIFFAHQQDPEANRMAAFTAADPADGVAFAAHWARIRAADDVTMRTILREGRVVGHVSSFVQDGETEVTYWIDRAIWGQGVATAALSALLGIVAARPLFARAASDNRGSLRVLEKCGFRVVGHDRGYANARGAEIDEVVLRLG